MRTAQKTKKNCSAEFSLNLHHMLKELREFSRVIDKDVNKLVGIGTLNLRNAT
jgi:hypothetical protein